MLYLTYSSISTFLNCHKCYFYRYDEKLKPIHKSWSQFDGTALHFGLQEYYKPSDLPRDARMLGILEVIKNLYDKERAHEGQYNLEKHKAIVCGMLRGYALIYPPDEFDYYKPEVPFEVEVNHPNLPEKKFILGGRVDAETGCRGKLFPLETKSTSEGSITRYLSRLFLDLQTDIYLYGYHRMGRTPVGMLYNIIRKPNLRQGGFENDEHFFRRIQKAYIEDTKREPKKRKYYFRDTVYRNLGELVKFEEELKMIAEDMAAYYPYKNPSRCSDFEGCDFKKACEGVDVSELFLQKARQHEELPGGGK